MNSANEEQKMKKTTTQFSFKPTVLPQVMSTCKLGRFPMDGKLGESFQESNKRYNRQYFRIQTQAEKQEKVEKDKGIEDVYIQMQNNQEDIYEDMKPKELVGPESIKNYYQTYKKITRIKEQNKLFAIQNSVQTNLIIKSEQLRLLPCKMGLIKQKGESKVLAIENHKFGDKYVEVLSEGLRTLPVIQDFNFNSNRIKENGASLILPLISKQARSIEMVSNIIGRKGLEPVLNVLPLQTCKIQILNLEDNQLGDLLAQELFKSMQKNNTVKLLNVSKNQITNASYPFIKQMIETNDSLEELYLHWNLIKGSGGAELFKALIPNKNMKVLDLSYNLLGCGGQSLTPILKQFFEENKDMIHLDLSANQFSLPDSQSISESLKENHTIYGFHFNGNFGYVDSKGFLIIQNEMRNFNQIHTDYRIRGCETHSKPYSKGPRSEKMMDVCWICDGWQGQKFEWIPNKSGNASEEPIFIHFDFEGYEAIFLGKPDENGIFSTNRMVPTGELDYFYTGNQLQVASLTEPLKIHNEKFRVRTKIADQVTDVLLDETNHQMINKGKPVIQDWDPNYDVKPRTCDPIYIPIKQKKQKRAWSFPISIWAPKYKFDTEELLRKCFERDWNCCKITKFVKKVEEQEQIKEMLWQSYKPIRETYRYYSAINPSGDVFSMSQNPTSEFVNQCQLIDGKQMKLADVDLKFIATCSASQSDWKGNFRNPERYLVRYQMMEFLVRLSEDKYIRNQPGSPSYAQATRMILDQCLPYMSQFDSHKWRMERYFIEQCDDVCKKHKQVIDYVYMHNSQKKVKPGQAPFMCLDELKDVCNTANLYDENFVERDVNLAFCLSMLTQVDELESDRLFQMQWIEFMEALARIADKYSPIGIGKQNDKEWTYEQRFSQPLYYKLEAFMVHLIHTSVDEETKKNWKIPTVSMFDVIEEDDQ
ncbi:unnamed protein product [Paramecium sonneborni]|uniref:Leucine Rich Repeat family protein n=1 Tax=Paramecium sonneborni TaxID=65129 RepID=A0A8S1MJ89_9CILI|nr:unnamed protein product [Paramecium sonneborni]